MKRYVLTQKGYIIDTKKFPIYEGKTKEIGVVYLDGKTIKVRNKDFTHIIEYVAFDSDSENELKDLLYSIITQEINDTRKFDMEFYFKSKRLYEEYRKKIYE